MLSSTLRLYPLFILVSLSACSHYSYDLGQPLTKDQYSGITAGAPLAMVLAELGPPLRVSALPNGLVLAWEHWEVRETRVGISLGFAGANAMSLDWGTTATEGEYLLLAFDEKRRVIDGAFTRWKNDAGGGQAIQPFGGFLSVADVDDLLQGMSQHRWGASSLKRLPAALNGHSDPDVGANGLEQRGTPRGIGQRVLEMD